MKSFEEVVNTRRSIRKYSDKEVEEEKVTKILKSGMQAPGSRLGAEPWEFLVIRNKEVLGKIGEIKPRVADCNVAIVLIANTERAFYKDMWQQDLSAACENMLLEASNLDLGGLWNGVAPDVERMDKIADIINLPEGLMVFSIVTLGYPGEGQENKFMDKFDSSRIHYEKY